MKKKTRIWIQFVAGIILFIGIALATTTVTENDIFTQNISASDRINATTDICIQGGNCLSNLFNQTTNNSITNYINSIAVGGEPLWNANWTAFNTSWSNTFNQTTNDSLNNYIATISGGGITWATATNGTLFKTSQWNSTNSSYALESILMNGSFFNGVDSDTFVSNYSTFLTHISSAILNNGSYLNPSEYETKWNANYSLVPTLNILNNGSYLNVPDTDTFVANYSTFLNHITFGNIGNGTIWSWVMNGSLAKSSELNNGSYLNIAETDSLAYNGTLVAINILNNGSYLNVPSTDTFIANYSSFLNKINWGDVGNGTLVLSSILNNGSYLNVPWNATNTSYYLDSNPYGFYNSTSNIGNWTNDKGSYTLLSILNNGSYLNTVVDTDTFVNNYSTFLTHMTMSNATTQNNSIVNWVTATFSSLANTMTALGNWSADKVNYPELTILNNGSYLNVAETDSKAYNGSLMWTYQWNATNTSYLTSTGNIGNWTLDKSSYTLLSVLNNGSYLNSATIDWSNIINGTIWSWSMNGTLAKSSELNNGTYVTNLILNNGSYLNPSEYETKWNANYSLIPTLNILNNGSYFNTASTDTFAPNYTTFLEHTANNVSLKNYIDNTFNTTRNNEITRQNTSMTNWITNVFNVTRNNYLVDYVLTQNNSIVNWISNVFNVTVNNEIARQNTSLVNYISVQNTSLDNLIDLNNVSVTNLANTHLDLAGGRMTGNITMSGLNNITFDGNGVIYNNVTCTIIKGSTGSLWVC